MRIMKYALCGGGIGFTLSGLAFLLAGRGHGSYMPACLFFAPLVLFGWRVVFLGGGMLLHIAYAILLGLGNRRNKGAQILLILALFHFGAVGSSIWVLPELWDPAHLENIASAAPFLTALSFVSFILVLLISVYAALMTQDIEDGAPLCRKCRYNLTGNISGICPECGEEVPHERGENPSET